jgi:hypothetical protein
MRVTPWLWSLICFGLSFALFLALGLSLSLPLDLAGVLFLLDV